MYCLFSVCLFFTRQPSVLVVKFCWQNWVFTHIEVYFDKHTWAHKQTCFHYWYSTCATGLWLWRSTDEGLRNRWNQRGKMYAFDNCKLARCTIFQSHIKFWCMLSCDAQPLYWTLEQIFPIAYRLVKSESAEAYSSFLNQVLAIQLDDGNVVGPTMFDIVNNKQTVLYSNRAKGLLKSVLEKVPLVKHHPWCELSNYSTVNGCCIYSLISVFRLLTSALATTQRVKIPEFSQTEFGVLLPSKCYWCWFEMWSRKRIILYWRPSMGSSVTKNSQRQLSRKFSITHVRTPANSQCGILR